MFCHCCGVPVHADQKYCTNCGTKIPIHNESPDAAVPAEGISIAPLFNLNEPEEINRKEAVCISVPKSVPKRPILPYWILGILFAIGLLIFFLFPYNTEKDSIRGTQSSFSGEKNSQTESGSSGGHSITITGDYFSLIDGALTFFPEQYTGGRVLQVPDAINGIPVKSLADRCFYDCDEITTIILPASLIAIGNEAFAEASSLRGVFIPESVESIGNNAFHNCADLEAIYVPSSVDFIGSECFSDCPALIYIFYNGMYDEWRKMYSEHITPFTWVVCLDGDYRHGG